MSLLKVNYDVLDLIIAQTVQCSHNANANDIRQLLTLMGVCKSLRNFVLQRHRLWRSLSNFPRNKLRMYTRQLFETIPAFISTVREIRFGESSNCQLWSYLVFFIINHTCKKIGPPEIPSRLRILSMTNLRRDCLRLQKLEHRKVRAQLDQTETHCATTDWRPRTAKFDTTLEMFVAKG